MVRKWWVLATILGVVFSSNGHPQLASIINQATITSGVASDPKSVFGSGLPDSCVHACVSFANVTLTCLNVSSSACVCNNTAYAAFGTCGCCVVKVDASDDFGRAFLGAAQEFDTVCHENITLASTTCSIRSGIWREGRIPRMKWMLGSFLWGITTLTFS